MSASQQHLLPSGILDNRDRGNVGEFLRQTIQPGAQLSFVSAYFTIYAYQQLRTSLDQIDSLRFLFGEPRFLRHVDPEHGTPRTFTIREQGLQLNDLLTQRSAARDCAAWIREKVAIRSVKQAGLLHAKLYHIQTTTARALLGSSNFTLRGLGLAPADNNLELNLVVDSDRDRADLLHWFDEVWNNPTLVSDVRDEVLHYLEQLYADQSPQLVYYATLYQLFRGFLEQQQLPLLDDGTPFAETAIWQALFAFQRDGVRGVLSRILQHNGCILADSVGLGKTYTALAVIKYFELRNERVLVLCPKRLRENWTVYQAQNNSPQNPFLHDRFNYTVLSHTDLSRDDGFSDGINLATLNWGNYDLVVIDESHNFRNNTRGRRDEYGNVIRMSRYERLMEQILKSGVRTKVLLLSATPVNNDLRDLRNQLQLLTAGTDSSFQTSLSIESIEQTITTAQRAFNDWSRKRERRAQDLLGQLPTSFLTLLDNVTIARSRRHIQRYYSETIAELGGFPERLPPHSLYPEIDSAGLFLSYDRLNREISNYRLSLFNPTRYLKPEWRQHYERATNSDERTRFFSQGLREISLIGMMKVNFLKRLESSVASFRLTLQRTIDKIEALEQQIERFNRLPDATLDLSAAEPAAQELEDEELRDLLQVGESLKFQLAHLDLQAWQQDLRADKQQLHSLALAARDVTPARDAKLALLKQLIRRKAEQPTTDLTGRANRKVLVFTAFADTADYLYTNLADWARQELGIHCALVTGGGNGNRATFGHTQFGDILANFAPRAKQRTQQPNLPQQEEIDLLIATDCISEGQNLQDCDYLVNYDIHWNPVRIIQRFGRIDRLRSPNRTIQLVNFWPTQDLNQYLNLTGRVEARLALVDVTATGDDNLLALEAVKTQIAEELHYRDQQLLRLRTELPELEEISEGMALTDLTLDDFRSDLLRFLQHDPRVNAETPLGLYAVVAHDPAVEAVPPGVIFCLRQKEDSAEGRRLSPLYPFFLVYIADDGNVRYGAGQARRILEIYRALCNDQPQAAAELCRLFDEATDDGREMTHYNILLAAAAEQIERHFQQRAAAAVSSGRGGMIPPRRRQIRSADDLDLISWLVIQRATPAADSVQ